MTRSLLFLAFLSTAVLCSAQEKSGYSRLIMQARSAMQRKDYASAAVLHSRAIALYSDIAEKIDRYNAACMWARVPNGKDSAFYHLYKLVKSYPTDSLGDDLNNSLMAFRTDRDFESLYTDKRWPEFCLAVNKLNKKLVVQLDSILYDDQVYRSMPSAPKDSKTEQELADLRMKRQKQDSINLVKVKKIVQEHGWLGEQEVGKKGNKALFLVIQHADLATQKKYLPVIREAVANKKARPADLALLEDRIELAEGRKQIYGSQIGAFHDGSSYVLPMINPDSVDIRRKAMKLPPLKYYLKNWNLAWDPELYKKQLPEIEKKMEAGAKH